MLTMQENSSTRIGLGNAIPLRALFFEGGSVRRSYAWFCDESLKAEVEEVWGLVKQDYPRLLPNLTSQSDFLAFDATGCSVLWSDLPLPHSGLRLFTVCYQIQLGRAFWNVFSFAYAPEVGTQPLMRRLMAYTPETWRSLAQSLNEDSRELRLAPSAAYLQEYRELAEEWDACGAWVSRFPKPGHLPALLNGRVAEPWREHLGPPAAAQAAPLPRGEASPSVETHPAEPSPPASSITKQRIKHMRKLAACLFLLLLCAGLLWATPGEHSQKPIWKLEQEIEAHIPRGLFESSDRAEYREPLEELLRRDTKAAAEGMRRCAEKLQGSKVEKDIERLRNRASEIELVYSEEAQRVKQMPLRELRPYILKHEWLSDDQPGDDAKFVYGIAALLESTAFGAAEECRQCAEGIRMHEKDKQALLERARKLDSIWNWVKTGVGGLLSLLVLSFIIYLIRIHRAQRV